MTTPHPNPSAQQQQSSGASGLPSSSTFSFKAPFPVSQNAAVSALKHRRVSLASPSSPRLVQPWSFRDEMGLHIQAPEVAASSSPPTAAAPEKKGKVRKLDPKLGAGDEHAVQDKKPRKKWSIEETEMLVQGCQIHGVGNWKTILQDPDLKFHDRSAVDLKDRFRTYFPDAYQKHYPNARTHLSSKIRSTLADGTSLFEKTRNKRRRPFTEAEDRALKAGYEKHGTTWATIVKDPIFAEQNRRSTDLRDRFRNAFPDLYQAAGYKPRSASKKVRAADDQTAGPVRSRRRAKTSQGLLRGGTKSVPQSTACSEDEDSEEESEPVFVENVSTTKKVTNKSVPTLSSTATKQIIDADDEMELLTLDSTDALVIPDFLPNNVHSDMETWSSGLNTPTHSSTAAWSTAAVSPTSSHLSDLFMNAAAGASTTSSTSSPFIHRRTGGNIDNNFGMIGKSAWGTDWFSPNPRLDASSSNSSSFMDPSNFSPASPFSFQGHGVLDRYDLFPPHMPDGNVSEAGLGDTFGDDDMGGFGGAGSGAGNGAGASSGGTGFKGYHSQIAGDLISGAGARMHPHHHYNNHNHQPTSFSLSSLYGTSFASGFGNSSGTASSSGLGLEGIPENVTGIHPMQLHSHASSTLSIGELGLTGISLNESGKLEGDGSNSAAVDDAMDGGEERQQPQQNQVQEKNEGDVASSSASAASTASGTIANGRPNEPDMDEEDSSLLPFGMEDLVDMNELHHVTPPGTPLVTQPRPMRRAEGLMMFEGTGAGPGGGGSGHARSISVPPSEARNGHHDVGVVPMSVDDVGLHSMHLGYHGFGAPGIGMAGLHSIFNASSTASGSMFNSSSSASGSTEGQQFQERQQSRTVDPHRLSGAGVHSPISPSSSLHHHHLQQRQQQQEGQGDDDDQHQHTSELTPLFPANLILSPTAATTNGISLPSPSPQSKHTHVNSASGGGSNHHTPVIDHHHTPVLDHDQQREELWRSASSFSSFSGDYNLPFLDLHYFNAGAGIGAGSLMFGNNHGLGHNLNHHPHPNHPNQLHHSHSHHSNYPHLPNHSHPHHLNLHLHNTLGLDVSSMDDLYSTTAMTMEATRQGLALDLAQTNAQMGISHTNFNLNPHANLAPGPQVGFERTPSPSGTIRHHQRHRKPLLGEMFSPPGDSRDVVDVGGSNTNADAKGNANGNGNADGGGVRRLSDGSKSSNMHTSTGISTSNNTSNTMSRSSSDDSRAAGGRGSNRVRKLTTAGINPQTTSALPPTTTATATTTPMTRMPTTTTTIGRSMSHHRGQSAANATASVCPQDLMLRSGDNHKRKRASWDGGLG